MVNKGDYVIRDEEHVMTVGVTPDVLLMRDGEYTKLRDTDVILGKLEIGNVYYSSAIATNITLTEDIPHKSYLGNIVIGCEFGEGCVTNASLKYLSKAEPEFNIGDNVTLLTDEYTCIPKGDNCEVIMIEFGFMANIPYKVKHSNGHCIWVSPNDIKRTPEDKHEFERRFKVGDKVDVTSGCGAPNGIGTIVELRNVSDYKVRYNDYDWFVHGHQLSIHAEPEFERRFKIGDKVDARAGCGAPAGTGTVVELMCNESYRVDYGNDTWCTHDDYLTIHEPEDEHEFNVGDNVKFDTFVSGTGVVTEVDRTGYWIETSDCDGYENVYSSKKYVTIIETKELKIGDKLEYGKWKLEVIDDELIITNEFPDDVIKLDIDSNGWIMNSRDETIHKW